MQGQRVELLVGTGAMCTRLPHGLLRGMGIAPTGRRSVRLASGEVKKFQTGEAYIEVEGI